MPPRAPVTACCDLACAEQATHYGVCCTTHWLELDPALRADLHAVARPQPPRIVAFAEWLAVVCRIRAALAAGRGAAAHASFWSEVATRLDGERA